MQIGNTHLQDLKLVPRPHLSTVLPAFSTKVFFFGTPGGTFQPLVLQSSPLEHQTFSTPEQVYHPTVTSLLAEPEGIKTIIL